jgi:beta-glucosidase/6-phospho-beta-glucosidase/beta-galactosidase
MGGQCFPNQVAFINQSISDWLVGNYYQEVLEEEATQAAEKFHQKQLIALEKEKKETRLFG